MNLIFKGVYKTNLYTNVSKKEYIFEVPVENALKVKIIIDPYNLEEFTSYYETPVSEELYSSLLEGYDNESLDHTGKKELSKIRDLIKEACNNFMKTVIYLLDWHEHKENNTGQLKKFMYSYDGEKWYPVPYIIFGPLSVGDITIYPRHTINPSTEDFIHSSLSGEYWNQYVALNYLHKAKRESDNRHKWINATISAELAIKEFLIKNKPDLKSFIIEVPSPPLHRLYGNILEALYSERSPKVTELNKGAQKRNAIIHRPDAINISNSEVNQYIKDVEIAIFHLFSLEYGQNYLIKSYFE